MQYTPNAEFRFRDKTSLNFVGQKLVICGRRFFFFFLQNLHKKENCRASKQRKHPRKA